MVEFSFKSMISDSDDNQEGAGVDLTYKPVTVGWNIIKKCKVNQRAREKHLEKVLIYIETGSSSEQEQMGNTGEEDVAEREEVDISSLFSISPHDPNLQSNMSKCFPQSLI